MKNKKIFLFIILAVMLVLPTKVLALNDDEIKEKKEVTIKSVVPTNDDEFWQMTESFYAETSHTLTDCNASYTTCTVSKVTIDENDMETSEVIATGVTLKYEYDADVKKVVDDILKNIPQGGKQFYIEDVHMLKWILDEMELDKVDDQNMGINPIKYSKEFNSFIGYNNFFFEPRMGDDTMYANFAEGTSQFKYNGTIYGYGHMATRVNHVLYVSNNETDIIGALKTRLSKYFNIEKIEKDNDVTIDDLIDDYLEQFREDYNLCVQKKALEQELATLTDQEEINAKQNQINNLNYYGPEDLDEQYASADEYLEAMRDEITDVNSIDAMWNIRSKFNDDNLNVYVVYFSDYKDDDDKPIGVPVFVLRDSSKVFNDDLEVKTRDAKSGVTISNVGTSKKLPFDTLIQVSKLTSGTDYNKVVSAIESLLNNKDAIEMFDLKLFSNALENYVTKLDDGSFKVKIPVSDKLKNAPSLIAYYVDENNKVKEYPVTFEVIDNVRYAVFTTDHFSIYTLAEKVEAAEPKFKLTFNFNGGNRQGELEYIDESVAVGIEVNKANFIDTLGVTAPEGKELDAIEINGTRYELGSDYLLNKDTTFKYIWKDAPNEETLPDEKEEKTDSKGETVPKTFDNINSYIIMLVISAITLIGTIIVITRKKLIKNK